MKAFGFLLLLLHAALCLDNGQGKKPPMGFSTWNHFYCNINEHIIKSTADAIITLGLRDLGYVYINIDDCWMAPKRDERNRLVPDPIRFPNGIAALADYCHERGLKLGIYSSAGVYTCQKLPASLHYEEIDAATFAAWGIDYLKYDNCYHEEQAALQRYTKMRDALNKTGRSIYYSLCSWGQEDVWEWGNDVGNSWRTTEDIEDNFDSIRAIYKHNIVLDKKAGPGGWNDPDMLEVGNGRLTTNEYMTHFALWAMAKSPLIIGCDLAAVSSADLNILKNKEIIDLNQDELGKQAYCALNCDYSPEAEKAQITVMRLKNGDYAIALTNWNDNKILRDVAVSFAELKFEETRFKVRDLWKKADLGVMNESLNVGIIEIHDTQVFRLAKV